MKKKTKFSYGILLIIISILVLNSCNLLPKAEVRIIWDPAADPKEQLAAKELQRYLYLLTDTLPELEEIDNEYTEDQEIIYIGNKTQDFIQQQAKSMGVSHKISNLGAQEYFILTKNSGKGSGTLIVGGSSQGVLYAAYDFLEEQGIWFDISGDIIPDIKRSCSFGDLEKTAKPVFEKRGLQPFHDFPEGPDYWDYDTYQAVISQIAKMRMNFLGFHTYPEGWVNGQAEPTVWIGLPEDVNEDGTVKYSYPSTFANTSRKHIPPLTGQLPWWYAPMATSDFVAGASMLFDRDAYGADFLNNKFPMPETPEDMNEMFNNTGEMLNDAFSLAKELGVETAIGTEIPITIPIRVKERMREKGLDPESEEGLKELYKGIFKRIEATHPLDYYWFWTSESWLWEGHADEQQDEAIRQLKIIREVWDEVQPDFKLATCGWTLGPPKSPTAFQELLPEGSAMASINLFLGFTPVSPDFANVTSVDTWAIPWLEDDPALCNPQLWAGRVRRDAADALHYGSEGLMGIFWRTRELSPQFGTLARAGWNHEGWNPYLTDEKLAAKKPGESGLARDLPIEDFYLDWSNAMFGENVGKELADIFTSLDGGTGEDRNSRIPRPTNWDLGPGGIHITVKTQDELDSTYAFIDQMASIRPRLTGPGNTERFDFWLNSFKSAEEIARIGLLRHQLDQQIEKIDTQADKQTFVKETILPIRISLSRAWETMITTQIERTSAYDVIGTICNLEQHSRESKQFISEHDSLISAIIQTELPVDTHLSKEYKGSPRIVVPTVRSFAASAEAPELKVIIVDKVAPANAVLKCRELGDGKYQEVQLNHVARGVYSVELPAIGTVGLEYFIEVELADGTQKVWPATAPSINQTIISM
jgi:hypothetical protein